MSYGEAKVYFDGSHYIAIPHTTRIVKKRPKAVEEKITVEVETPFEMEDDKSEPEEVKDLFELIEKSQPTTEKKKVKYVRQTTKRELFEEYYKESLKLAKRERSAYVVKKMLDLFESEKEAQEYVKENMERKQRNLICRRIRMTRKANLQEFNYFCTFTYDDKKHTEESFKKKLKMQLSSFASRRKWKYMGVWERSPKKQRLHFHGIFYIPEGSIPGELLPFKDYSFSTHRMQVTWQSLYFNEHFGRSDFEKIEDKYRMGEALAYLMKYLEKTGERIVYSKGLPQFFISDIMDEDIACKLSEDESDNKVVLFDNFGCWDEGCYIGQVSPEVIEQLRKVA